MSRFDSTAPVLLLAPHLLYPPHTGANILADQLGRHFSGLVPYIDVLAQQAIVRYANGKEVSRTIWENQARSKKVAAIRTVLLRSHFTREKFLTPTFIRLAQQYLRSPDYGAVIHSFLYTASLATLVPYQEKLHIVLTHNDEFKWYDDIYRNTRNPIAKWAAVKSRQWLEKFFCRHAQAFIYAHVTEADYQGYRHYAEHNGYVIPVGVSLPTTPPVVLPPHQMPVRLLFIGALGVNMNHDALVYFAERFYPILKQALGDDLEVMVMGSTPSDAIKQLCKRHQWTLNADVSEEELAVHLSSATFSLLPFSYATGAKLKLLKSLAHGTPFLATSHVQAQMDDLPALCLFSDDPAAWLDHICQVQVKGIDEEERNALLDVARKHSWEASARKLYDALLTV